MSNSTDQQTDASALSDIFDDPLPPVPLGGRLIGEENLYEGSYAHIWRGKWWPPGSSDPQDVAIKQLKLIYLLSDSEKALVEQYARLNKRLRREARAHAVEHHPRIVPLIGYRLGRGVHWSPPCLVMPWYEGGNLKQYLRSSPNADKLKLMTQAAEGLAHLHRLGTIHGDVRLENILVDKDGNAAIGDFGLSQIRQANRNDNTSGPMTGHIFYRAPEAWEDNRCLGTDVFAFAGNLLAIFSGWTPFYMHRGSEKWRIQTSIMDGVFPSRDDHQNVEDWVWDLMEWCWQVNPNNRPTMDEVMLCMRTKVVERSTPT